MIHIWYWLLFDFVFVKMKKINEGDKMDYKQHMHMAIDLQSRYAFVECMKRNVLSKKRKCNRY